MSGSAKWGRFAIVALTALGLVGYCVVLRVQADAECQLSDRFLPGVDTMLRGMVAVAVVIGVWLLAEYLHFGWWALPLGLVVAVIAAWVLISLTSPNAYPNVNPACTGNLPSWWPNWAPRS